MSISRFMMQAAAGRESAPTEIGQAFGGGFYAGNIIQGGVEYYLIVAPKASGESSSRIQFKTSQTSSGAATQTLNNGPAATAAMANSTHPAANFCAGLTIGGFSDWYLPARDELEVIYRNLKPTANNNATADREKSTITYPEGDDVSSDTMGRNRNSSPARSGYSSSNPSRTSVSAFIDGGTEAFGTGRYWSSTELNNSRAWVQDFFNGNQIAVTKNNTPGEEVRAVRRVAV